MVFYLIILLLIFWLFYSIHFKEGFNKKDLISDLFSREKLKNSQQFKNKHHLITEIYQSHEKEIHQINKIKNDDIRNKRLQEIKDKFYSKIKSVCNIDLNQ